MSLLEQRDGARLCYVSGPWAYFTTKELGEQWGDDWNDVPYEHNAGIPYMWRNARDKPQWHIFKLAFDSDSALPDDWCGSNSPYSVQAINKGVVPWLRPDPYNYLGATIMAGTTYRDFIWAIEQSGGRVYVPYSEG